MRLISTNKVSTDKIRVHEAAQETTFRSVMGGVEGIQELILSVHAEPPRCEIHRREVPNGMRINWKASSVALTQILIASTSGSFEAVSIGLRVRWPCHKGRVLTSDVCDECLRAKPAPDTF